jgi:hypothetical protein
MVIVWDSEFSSQKRNAMGGSNKGRSIINASTNQNYRKMSTTCLFERTRISSKTSCLQINAVTIVQEWVFAVLFRRIGVFTVVCWRI